jgi:hypothetical protein
VGSRKQPRCSQIAARTGEGGRLCDDDGSEAGRARNIWRVCGYSWGIRIKPGNLRREPGDHKEEGGRAEDGGERGSVLARCIKGKVAAGRDGGR